MYKRIIELRNTLNLTQKAFAEKIGYTQGGLCDIEHNRCQVSDRVIILICQTFNVNEEWLRFGTRGNVFKR